MLVFVRWSLAIIDVGKMMDETTVMNFVLNISMFSFILLKKNWKDIFIIFRRLDHLGK